MKRLWASFDEQTEIPNTAEPLTNATQPRTTLDELRESLTNYENVGAINEYDDYSRKDDSPLDNIYRLWSGGHVLSRLKGGLSYLCLLGMS